MHNRITCASLVLTAFAALAGCSMGSISGNGPSHESPTTPAGGGESFAPASDEPSAVPTDEQTHDPTEEVLEGEDGDDPVPHTPPADAGPSAPPANLDSGSTATNDSGTAAPPSADSGAADSARADSGAACEDPSSLKQLVGCITDRMPREGSDRYAVPTPALHAAWRSVIRQMLAGSCATIAVPAELSGMRVGPFRDRENGRTYCVLQEVDDKDGDGYVDRGFGTFVVDPAAERELVHSAPHPFTDETTEQEAVAIFRETHSRAFLFTGVHRRASTKSSSCQPAYHLSDAAHEDTHLFHAATAELAAFYGTTPWTEIQWHGMSTTTCAGVNAFMTYGVSTSPAADSQLVALRNAMRAAHPGWALHVPGTAACSVGGTSNVQGRMLNQVAAGEVCGTSTKTSYGRFIHIEQQPEYRDPNDWIAAVKTAFPAK